MFYYNCLCIPFFPVKRIWRDLWIWNIFLHICKSISLHTQLCWGYVIAKDGFIFPDDAVTLRCTCDMWGTQQPESVSCVCEDVSSGSLSFSPELRSRESCLRSVPPQRALLKYLFIQQRSTVCSLSHQWKIIIFNKCTWKRRKMQINWCPVEEVLRNKGIVTS